MNPQDMDPVLLEQYPQEWGLLQSWMDPTFILAVSVSRAFSIYSLKELMYHGVIILINKVIGS